MSEGAPSSRDRQERASRGLLRRALDGSALFAAATLFSRALGLLREGLAARFFGLRRERDMYVVAHGLAFQPVALVVTVVNAALLPVLAWAVREDMLGAVGATAAVLLVVGPTLLALAGLTAAGARWLGPWLVGRGQTVPAALLARLVRTSIWYVPLAGVGNVLAMLPLAAQRYAAPALAYAVPNVAVVAALVLLQPRLGIMSLAVGDVAGGLLFLVVIGSYTLWRWRRQWPAARPRWDLASRFGALAVPPLLQALAGSTAIVFERAIMARLPEGTLSAYDYSFTLTGVALGALIAGPMTVIGSLLAYEAAARDRALLTRRAEQALTLVLLVTVLAASVLLANAREITRVVYQGRAFSAGATQVTAGLLAWQVPPMLGYATADVLARVCNAMQDTLTPAAARVAGQGLRLALVSPMAHWLGGGGVALARLLGLLLAIGILAVVLRPRGLRLPWLALVRRLAVLMGLAAVAGALVAQLPSTEALSLPVQAAVLLARTVVQTAVLGGLVFLLCPYERDLLLLGLRRRGSLRNSRKTAE